MLIKLGTVGEDKRTLTLDRHSQMTRVETLRRMHRVLQAPHGRAEDREGAALIQLNPTPDVLHDGDKKVPKVKQRPRRINHLPSASTVQTCLPACRAVVNTTRSYECAFDAVRVDVQVVVRQNVLKELNRTNTQTRNSTRSRAPLADRSNATTETRNLSLEGHAARVETDASHASERRRRRRRTSQSKRASDRIGHPIQLIRVQQPTRAEIVLELLHDRDLDHARKHLGHVSVNFI